MLEEMQIGTRACKTSRKIFIRQFLLALKIQAAVHGCTSRKSLKISSKPENVQQKIEILPNKILVPSIPEEASHLLSMETKFYISLSAFNLASLANVTGQKR